MHRTGLNICFCTVISKKEEWRGTWMDGPRNHGKSSFVTVIDWMGSVEIQLHGIDLDGNGTG